MNGDNLSNKLINMSTQHNRLLLNIINNHRSDQSLATHNQKLIIIRKIQQVNIMFMISLKNDFIF